MHEDEAATPRPMLQPSALLNDTAAFNSCLSQPQVPQHCQIFPSLKPSSNTKPLKFIIQETAKHQRSNFYEWRLASDGDQTFPEPVVIGKARSTLRGNTMMFKATKKGPVLFRFRQFKRLTNKPVFFIYGHGSREDIFYTITKRYHWGSSIRAGDDHMGPEERKWKHKQKLAIYAGKLTTAREFAAATPLYEGLGQKSKYWKFFKTGANNQPEQVGVMTRQAKELTIAGYNEMFELEINGTNVDAGAIMTGITVADLHQNSRNKGQHRLFGNWKLAADVVG